MWSNTIIIIRLTLNAAVIGLHQALTYILGQGAAFTVTGYAAQHTARVSGQVAEPFVAITSDDSTLGSSMANDVIRDNKRTNPNRGEEKGR